VTGQGEHVEHVERGTPYRVVCNIHLEGDWGPSCAIELSQHCERPEQWQGVIYKNGIERGRCYPHGLASRDEAEEVARIALIPYLAARGV
jgi:hypothetical protein